MQRYFKKKSIPEPLDLFLQKTQQQKFRQKKNQNKQIEKKPNIHNIEEKQLSLDLQVQKQLIKFCQFVQNFQCKICYETYSFNSDESFQRTPLIICEDKNIKHQMCSSCWTKHNNNFCPFCRKIVHYQPFPNQNLLKFVQLSQKLNFEIFSISFDTLLKNIEPILKICRQNTGQIIKYCWQQSQKQKKVNQLQAQMHNLNKEINLNKFLKEQLRETIQRMTLEIAEKDQLIIDLKQKLKEFKQNQKLMMNHCQELVLKVETSLANINVQQPTFQEDSPQKQSSKVKIKSQRVSNSKQDKKNYKENRYSHKRRQSSQNIKEYLCRKKSNDKNKYQKSCNQIHKKSKKEIQQLKRILVKQRQNQYKLDLI